MTRICIYTAGEIHSNWREDLAEALESRGVSADLVGPQPVHERSDDIGEAILGDQPGPRYRDLMGARVNTLRTRFWMRRPIWRSRGSGPSTSSGTRQAMPEPLLPWTYP